MSHQQYNVSEEMLRLFKIKQKQRQEAKAYYQRIISNPHRPIDSGAVFDPVLFRFKTLGPYQINHYRVTPKTLWYAFSLTLFPLFVIYKVAGWEVRRTENLLRAGLISSEDRIFKLVY